MIQSGEFVKMSFRPKLRFDDWRQAPSEPEYVLLEHLTDEDVKFNVNRLRKEADAKLHHATALEAWWQKRDAA